MEKAIKLVYYSEVIDMYGRVEASAKGPIIYNVLHNVEDWNDDMTFQDVEGNTYFIDDLIGKEVELDDVGIFTVPTDEC